MRIFLKERATGLWLKPSGRWEATREGAVEFQTGTDAISRADTFQTLDIQVVFHAEDPHDTFTVSTERDDLAVPAA